MDINNYLKDMGMNKKKIERKKCMKYVGDYLRVTDQINMINTSKKNDGHDNFISITKCKDCTRLSTMVFKIVPNLRDYRNSTIIYDLILYGQRYNEAGEHVSKCNYYKYNF